MRLHPWEHQRHGHGGQQVGQQRVGGEARRAAAQLGGDDGRRRGGGADEAHHQPLEHFAVHLVHGAPLQQRGHQQAGRRLKQQQPSVPGFGAQFAYLHLAEGEQQLGEDEQRGEHVHYALYARLERGEHGRARQDEVSQCARHHGHGQRPVFQKADNGVLFHVRKVVLAAPEPLFGCLRARLLHFGAQS